MGKREVTIYTCDGCKASSTLPRIETPRGYKRVSLSGSEAWLCTICYGAVEWVVRFQGITIPPKVYGHGARGTLRSSADLDHPDEQTTNHTNGGRA